MAVAAALPTEDARLVARSALLTLERRRQPRAVSEAELFGLAEEFILLARAEDPATPREKLRAVAAQALANRLGCGGVA